jgi:RNA polymerase sigma factor (sigma-70 family)
LSGQEKIFSCPLMQYSMKGDLNINLLIEQIKNSVEAAEFKLFRLFYPYVRSICNRYGSNEDESQEMANDTFLKVFRNIDKYDPEYEFKPWIRKVCINCCLDYQKKYFEVNKTVDLDMASFVKQEGADAIPEYFNPNECLSMLKELSPQYRTVFNLFVFEEMKHHEIAQELNISVGTSKSNFNRAKARLIEIMKEKKPEIVKNKMAHNG